MPGIDLHSYTAKAIALQKLVAANPAKGIIVSMAIGAAVLRLVQFIL